MLLSRFCSLLGDKKLFFRVSILLATLLWSSGLKADYVPFNGAVVAPNIAEFKVGQEGISLQLEIFVQDIPVFKELIPEEWVSKTPLERPDRTALLAEFARNGISIRREDGSVLPVELNLIEPRLRIDRAPPWAGKKDPMTGRVAPKAPDDNRVVFAELFYDFQGKRPDVLTISPPADSDGVPLIAIGMVVYDRTVPVTKFGYLSSDARLAIDWDDPWYSGFDNPNLRRHHQSAITTFLYVEPREVRHETLIRVRDLADWTELSLAHTAEMDAEAQARVKSIAQEFLVDQNPLTIDGAAIKPTSSRASFLTISNNALKIVENDSPLDPLSTFVGVILSFPVSELPDNVTVEWEMFNERVTVIPATLTDPAGPFQNKATLEAPLIEWKNLLRTYEDPQMTPVTEPTYNQFQVPLVSLVLLTAAVGLAITIIVLTGKRRVVVAVIVPFLITGSIMTRNLVVSEFNNPFAGPPDQGTSALIFSALLGNINIANLEVDERVRKQKLQTVATHNSEDAVMAEISRALSIRVAGGGIAKVNSVTDVLMTEVSALAGQTGFQSIAEWTVSASTGHWGHDHRRNLRYRALVEVTKENSAWTLAGITVLSAQDKT